jgi:hypothetical protein
MSCESSALNGRFEVMLPAIKRRNWSSEVSKRCGLLVWGLVGKWLRV